MARVLAPLMVCPGPWFCADRVGIDLPFHLYMSFFSPFKRTSLIWRPVSVDIEVDWRSFTKATCLLHHCRVRSLLNFVAWKTARAENPEH